MTLPPGPNLARPWATTSGHRASGRKADDEWGLSPDDSGLAVPTPTPGWSQPREVGLGWCLLLPWETRRTRQPVWEHGGTGSRPLGGSVRLLGSESPGRGPHEGHMWTGREHTRPHTHIVTHAQNSQHTHEHM